MNVTIRGNVYDIRWHYVPVISKTTETPVIRTDCAASIIDLNETGRNRYSHAQGPVSVTQNPNDRHEKRVARKLSLSKLLSGWLTKEERKKVWEQYFASEMGRNDHD